ncbi:MAG: MFS transporter, partial [Clostridia bacterium]|nr:MFS transporter [Clostridia bacterium]
MDEQVTLRDIFRTTVTCRPLLIVLLGSFLAFGKNMIQVAGSVFAIIVMNDENLYMYLGAMIIVGMLVSSLVTPAVTKKFGNKKVMIGSNLLSAAVCVAMYFVGYNSLIGLMVMVLLNGLL